MSANALGHCTTDLHMGSSSTNGINPFDQPGQQKSNMQDGLNLDSSNVDFMLAQTVSPFANLLLHVSILSLECPFSVGNNFRLFYFSFRFVRVLSWTVTCK